MKTRDEVEQILKPAGWVYEYRTGSFYKTIGDITFDIHLTYSTKRFDEYGLPVSQFAYMTKGSSMRSAIAAKGRGGKGHLRCQQNPEWYLKDENLLNALEKYKARFK